MKKLLMSAAAMAVLSAGAAAADENHDPACLDAACNTVALLQTPAAGGTATLQQPKYGTWGYDLAGRGSARPGEDFFQYANGAWFDKTEIPADRSSYGLSAVLSELAEQRTRAIMDDAGAGRLTGEADAARIGALYASFMDEARVESLDAQPLQADLNAIRSARSKDELARIMGASNEDFGRSIFGVGISDDAKNPDRYAVYLSQSGLGLPDRDYYLTPQFAAQKAKYQAYIATQLKNVGWADPEAAAKAVVDFETRIAEASWTRAQRRDRDKTYNPMTVAELAVAAPGFPWKTFMTAARLGEVERVIVSTNTSMPTIAKIFADAPIETVKAWQAYHLVNSAAPMLSKRFADPQFEFFGKTLSGQPQQRDRWKRGVGFTNGSVGESVGRVYVARHFTPEAKAKMDALVADLRTAMRGRIERLDWMSPETKVKALEKLSKFTVKIGYPSKWRDYSTLQATPGDLYGNAERSSAFEWNYRVARLNKPVDDEEWGMTPQTVNAYYQSTKNEIVFPAAILQPPYFDPDADPAVNYGAIGGVIGHEIIHGFDDQGRKSNGDGVLTDWWTAADAKRFEEQAAKLGAQYEAFTPIDGGKINGKLTMGENIGDLGGILLGLDAYKLSLKGKPAPVIDGYTGEQRVMLGWAQVWRRKMRDDALRQQLVSDPHSPSYYRAMAPLRNVDAWYTAFDIKPTDPLYIPPEQRVRIW